MSIISIIREPNYSLPSKQEYFLRELLLNGPATVYEISRRNEIKNPTNVDYPIKRLEEKKLVERAEFEREGNISKKGDVELTPSGFCTALHLELWSKIKNIDLNLINDRWGLIDPDGPVCQLFDQVTKNSGYITPAIVEDYGNLVTFSESGKAIHKVIESGDYSTAHFAMVIINSICNALQYYSNTTEEIPVNFTSDFTGRVSASMFTVENLKYYDYFYTVLSINPEIKKVLLYALEDELEVSRYEMQRYIKMDELVYGPTNSETK